MIDDCVVVFKVCVCDVIDDCVDEIIDFVKDV